MTPFFLIASLLHSVSDALSEWDAAFQTYLADNVEIQHVQSQEIDPQESAPEQEAEAPVEEIVQDIEGSVDQSGPDTAEPIEAAQTIETRPERSRDQERARLQSVLDNLDTLQARFVQINTDGSEDSGILYLDRPGRIRFDYNEPSPILLVADGSTVAIADTELETVDRAPIGQTPFKWLLNDGLDLTNSGAVNEVGRYDNQLYLTLIDPDGETDGRLTFVFADADPNASVETVELTGWYVIDALGSFTEVRLDEIETGLEFNPRLFILDDEDESDRRRTRR